MKRFACLCGGLAVLTMVQSAAGQVLTTNSGLAIWYDVRGNGGTTKSQLPQSITPTVAFPLATPGLPFTAGTSHPAGAGKNAVADVAAGNLGGPGDAQVLYISPRLPTVAGVNPAPGGVPAQEGLHLRGTTNKRRRDFSRASLFAYATVGDRSAALPEVISALGRDSQLVKRLIATKGTKLDTVDVTTYWDTALWSAAGTVATASDNLADQTNWTISSKAVKVPVAAGPIFSAAGGAVPDEVTPGPLLYRIAEIKLGAGEWDNGSATHNPPRFATYDLHDEVNNLLITRAYDGAGGATPEAPDFGYTTVENPPLSGLFFTGSDGGTPEASGGDGSTIGSTSAAADAIVVITTAFDSDNNGVVDVGDIAGFQAALGAGAANRQRELYLYDGNNDHAVDVGDIAFFQIFLNNVGGANNCNPPGSCP